MFWILYINRNLYKNKTIVYRAVDTKCDNVNWKVFTCKNQVYMAYICFHNLKFTLSSLTPSIVGSLMSKTLMPWCTTTTPTTTSTVCRCHPPAISLTWCAFLQDSPSSSLELTPAPPTSSIQCGKQTQKHDLLLEGQEETSLLFTEKYSPYWKWPSTWSTFGWRTKACQSSHRIYMASNASRRQSNSCSTAPIQTEPSHANRSHQGLPPLACSPTTCTNTLSWTLFPLKKRLFAGTKNFFSITIKQTAWWALTMGFL